MDFKEERPHSEGNKDRTDNQRCLCLTLSSGTQAMAEGDKVEDQSYDQAHYAKGEMEISSTFGI